MYVNEFSLREVGTLIGMIEEGRKDGAIRLHKWQFFYPGRYIEMQSEN